MAKLLSTVPLTAPAVSGSYAVDATFTMSENYTLSGSGAAPTVTLYWQYDQGSGTWIDIPTTGSTGLVASAGSQAMAAETTTYSRTITCKSAGAYVIRAKGVSSTPTTVYSVNQPTTTVAAVPTAPTNATTVSKTDVQIVMGWTDNSNNETGFKMFKNDVLVEAIAADSVSYTFTGLTAATQYDLAVRAANNGVDSAEAQLTETTNAEVGGTLFENQLTENSHVWLTYVGSDGIQTFTPQISHDIYKINLKLQKGGSPTGDIQAFIYSVNEAGTAIVSQLCASETKAASSISTSATLYTFTFTTNPSLLAGTKYAIVVTGTAGDGSNCIYAYLYYDPSTDIYTGGKVFGGTNYSDLYFGEYGEAVAVPIAPTNAHTDSKANVQIVMHWTDNATDETGYKMYKNDVCIETIAADSVSYTFLNLIPGTEYDLAVKATNVNGDSTEAQLTETTTGTAPPSTPYVLLGAFDIDSNDDGIIDATDWAAADAASGKNLGDAGYDRKFDILFANTVSSADVTWAKVDQGAGFNLEAIRNSILTGAKVDLTWPDSGSVISLKILSPHGPTIQKLSGAGVAGSLPAVHGWLHGTGHPYVLGNGDPNTPGNYFCMHFAQDMLFAAYKTLGYGAILNAQSPTHSYNIFFIGGDWQDLHNWMILEPQTGDVLSAADTSAPYDTTLIFFPIQNNSVDGLGLSVNFANKAIAYASAVSIGLSGNEETLPTGYTFRPSLGGGVGGGVHWQGFMAISSGNAAAFSFDGITWSAQLLPLPPSSPGEGSWYSIAYGNSMFVAVGNETAAASSPNGITWTLRTLPSSHEWSSVAYGGGMFVAVGNNSNAAASSPDGITWTARTLPSSAYWRSVAYGGGMFVAVSYNGAAAASSPDGITWTARTLPSSATWYSVTYGSGMFVAVSFGGTAAASSPDGITWTARTLPSSAYWRSVAYGNGVFVAVTYYSGDAAASSPDGITWTARTLPASSSLWTSVTYGGGMFVAVNFGSGTGTIAASSPDGITWTARTLPVSASWVSVIYGGAPPSISIVRSFPWVFKFQLCHKVA